MNLLLIPARYGSTRFPGKPLALIDGIPMVVRVYQQVKDCKGFDKIAILTDHLDIHLAALQWRCDSILQDVEAANGTERMAQYAAATETLKPSDIIINVQGDEPLMTADIPQRLLFNVKMHPQFVWTAVRSLKPSDRDNPDCVKCRFTHYSFVEGDPEFDYFSQMDIISSWSRMDKPGLNAVQIGVYGYTVKRLLEYLRSKPSEEEQSLQIECLRFREPLACFSCDYTGIGVDRPEDIQRVEERLK